MKTIKILKHFKLILIMIFALFYCCQTDNEDSLKSQNNSIKNQISSKLITGNQIPQVIQFIKTQSSNDLSFTLQPSIDSNRSSNDLVIGTLDTEKIRKVTNSEDKSNYTFTMDKEYPISEFSIVNYVVKETQGGYYSYFLEFIPDVNWLKTSSNINDLTLFTGIIIVYNRYGIYVGENVFSEGVRMLQSLRTNCPDNNDNNNNNNTTGGGDETSGNSDSSDSSDSTDSNDSSDGTNGDNIEIEITCGCAPGHEGGNENDSCSCTDTDIIITINFADQNDEPSTKTPLRNPCPPIEDNCNSQNDCEFGFDATCNCLENPDNENPSDGVILNLDTIMTLNAILGTNDSYVYPTDINSDDALYFDTVDLFVEFLQNPEFDLTQPLIDTDEGNRITTFRVDYGLTNIDLFVNQILNDPIENQEYVFVEVTSELSGLTIGTSWEQTAIEYIIVGNEAIITVFGNLNFNLFLESVGTIFTDAKIFELHIDINTGEPISIFDIED